MDSISVPLDHKSLSLCSCLSTILFWIPDQQRLPMDGGRSLLSLGGIRGGGDIHIFRGV